MKSFASSEAVFGSASRGDTDAFSDRDILIVDDDIEVLKMRQKALEASGWSVASYTFKKLIFLIEKKALFIQHLREESKLLRDTSGRLAALLSTFQPKNSYKTELHQNALLADLASIRPIGPTGTLWASDVLYVAMRNFGVLYLAEQKRYLFSFTRILEALADLGVIRGDALPALVKLRMAKTCYRSKQFISEAEANAILCNALEFLPDGFFPRHSISADPYKILLDAQEMPELAPAYHRLRNLERYFIALSHSNPSKYTLTNLEKLQSWIENPRAYASIAQMLEGELIAYLREGANHGSLILSSVCKRA